MREGQRDEHEHQHDQPVKDALHHNRRQAGSDLHVLVALEHVGADHFAGAERIDVVAHVADDDDREQRDSGIALIGRSR